MTISALLWRCALSFVSHTFLIVQFLVQPLHDVLQSHCHDSCGSALRSFNKLYRLFNDSILDIPDTIFVAAIDKNRRASSLEADAGTTFNAVSSPGNSALQIVAAGVNESSVTEQPKRIITTTLDHHCEAHAVLFVALEPDSRVGAGAGISRRDNAPKSYSIAVDVSCYDRSGPPQPIARTPAEHHTNLILREVHEQLNQPNLSASKASAGDSPHFQYLVTFKGGFVLIGLSNSGQSFWAHGPTSGPSGASAPLGKGRGKQRTGARVGKAGGRVPVGGRTSNKGTGNGNGDNNNNNDGNLEDGGAVTMCYACPFYKFDPVKHFRCFRKYELKRPSDVKQHILRCHTLGHLYCLKCWRTWRPSQVAEWETHAETLSCVRVPQPEPLLPREQAALESMELVGVSEPEKWYLMWNLLFVNHQPPSSPYMDCGPGELLWLLNWGRDNLQRQLPGLVLGLSNQMNPEALQNFGYDIDAIYRLPLTLDQPQVPRYRRQHALQQQSPSHLSPGVASGQTIAIQRQPILNGTDEVDWDQFLNSNVDVFDETMGTAGDNFPPGPHFPPPQPPGPPAPRA